MNRKVITMATLLAAYACTVGAATPHIDTVKLVSYQQKATAQAATMTNTYKSQVQTKQQSMSVTLPQSIELALQNNRELHQTQWDYEAALGQVDVAQSGKKPAISYGYSANHAIKEVGSVRVTGNEFGHRVGVKMPLYNQALQAQIEASKYNRDGSGAAVEEATQKAKLTATSNYLSLIMSRNKVGVAEQTVRDYEEHLKNANLQYSVGIVSKSDVLATNTRLENAKTILVEAKHAASVAEARFNNHIGVPVSTSIVTADKELTYKPYKISLEAAKQYGVYHRSDIARAAMAVKAAEESARRVDASDMPVVDANASGSMGGTSVGATDNKNWTIGATVSWNLWDGGASKANLKVAKVNVEKAKEAYAQTIEAVELQIHEAYLNMKSAEQKIVSTRAAVEAGQEDYRIKTLRYRSGVGTNVDVLDAETALATARNNYVDVLYTYNLNVATLERAMGVPVTTAIGDGLSVVNQGANK